MSRLIDADTLIEEIKDSGSYPYGDMFMTEAVSMIKRQPTVESQPFAEIKLDGDVLQNAVNDIAESIGMWTPHNAREEAPTDDGEYLVTVSTMNGYRFHLIAKYSVKAHRWSCWNTVLYWYNIPNDLEVNE